MKIDDLKRWAPLLLVGLPALWLGLYVWAWMARVGCGATALGECWLSALANWAGDVVMLGWMDTTLGAGFLAVLAATSVIVSTLLDRAARLHDANTQRMNAILETVARLQLQLRRLGHELSTRRYPEAVERALADAEVHCLLLVRDARPIAHLVMYCLSRIREIAISKSTPATILSEYQTLYMSILWAAILALENPDRYFRKDGQYIPGRFDVTGENRGGFNPAVLSEEEALRFSQWLDWRMLT